MFSRQVKRGANFSAYERDVLIDCIQAFKYVVEDKKTDSKSVYRKQQGWQQILTIYNTEAGVTKRTVKQLQSAWKNMKRITKLTIIANEWGNAEFRPRCTQTRRHESCRVQSVLDDIYPADDDHHNDISHNSDKPNQTDENSDDDKVIDKALKIEPGQYDESCSNSFRTEPTSIILPVENRKRSTKADVQEHMDKIQRLVSPTSTIFAGNDCTNSNPIPIQPKPPSSTATPLYIQSKPETIHRVQNTGIVPQSPAYQLVISQVQSTSATANSNLSATDLQESRDGSKHPTNRLPSTEQTELEHYYYKKLEHLERMKTMRLERILMRREHKEKMAILKAKQEYYKLKRDVIESVDVQTSPQIKSSQA